MTFRRYWPLVVAGFRQQSAYRLAALGGLVANVTFGLLKVSILFATVRASGGSVQGYDLATMSAYVWLSQGMLGSLNLYGRTEIGERIRVGDVVVDLIRPVNVQVASIATELGRALWALVPRTVPTVTIGIVFVGMELPGTFAPYALGLVSVVLGIVVSCTTVYLVATAGFWLVDNRGAEYLYMVFAGFFAGLFVPIGLFPGWLERVAHATPFPSMMMFPVDVLSGRVGGWSSVGLIGAQVGWLVLTLAAGHLLTTAGRHRLEVQGG